jgi:hypothetical protein
MVAIFNFASLPLLATLPPYTSVVTLIIYATRLLQKNDSDTEPGLPLHSLEYSSRQLGSTDSSGNAFTNQSSFSVGSNRDGDSRSDN